MPTPLPPSPLPNQSVGFTPQTAMPAHQAKATPQAIPGTMGSDWLTGNYNGPYSPELPGGYGGNAAVAMWQLYQNDPAAAGEATVQISPHYPTVNGQGLMADVVGYAAVDHYQLDTNHDGGINAQELAAHFSILATQPGTAQRLAQDWLRGHDVNQDGQISLSEHAATVLMETNAPGFIGYFQAAMAAGGNEVSQALAKAFYHLVPYNTPDNRNAHHMTMFNQPDMLRALVGKVEETFQLQGWLQAFGLK